MLCCEAFGMRVAAAAAKKGKRNELFLIDGTYDESYTARSNWYDDERESLSIV